MAKPKLYETVNAALADATPRGFRLDPIQRLAGDDAYEIYVARRDSETATEGTAHYATAKVSGHEIDQVGYGPELVALFVARLGEALRKLGADAVRTA